MEYKNTHMGHGHTQGQDVKFFSKPKAMGHNLYMEGHLWLRA